MDNRIDNIKTKENLADFISYLRQSHPERLSGTTIDCYLEAMEGFIRNLDTYYRNNSKDVPTQPRWKDFADILYSATLYD